MKHGTRSAYNRHRCRCDACTEANRVYMAKVRAGVSRPERGRPITGLLARCWCERHMRRIPPEVVKAGKTWTCKNPECRRIARAEGWRHDPPLRIDSEDIHR